MIYIGLDVHKRFSRMGCFDPATGEVHDLGSVSNDASALQGALEELPCCPPQKRCPAAWSAPDQHGGIWPAAC